MDIPPVKTLKTISNSFFIFRHTKRRLYRPQTPLLLRLEGLHTDTPKTEISHVSVSITHCTPSQTYEQSSLLQGSCDGEGDGVCDGDSDGDSDGDDDGEVDGVGKHSNGFTQRIGGQLKFSPHWPNTMSWL